MKKHIQIRDSYKIWKPSTMAALINEGDTSRPIDYVSMFIEWWLHNIGYWITRPFIFIGWIKKINNRCKHVDLMVEVEDAD